MKQQDTWFAKTLNWNGVLKQINNYGYNGCKVENMLLYFVSY